MTKIGSIIFIGIICIIGIFLTFLIGQYQRLFRPPWLSNPSLLYQVSMDEVFLERSIDEFLPGAVPPGKLHWIDTDKEKVLRSIPAPDGIYGVKLNPPTITLKVNGAAIENVVGMIAQPGLDHKMDYSEEEHSVLSYDVTNGIVSGGDIIYLFHEHEEIPSK